MDFLSRVLFPVVSFHLERGNCICDKINIETKVPSRARRGGYAMRRGQANDDQRIIAMLTQLTFRVRADKGAVDMFLK